MEAGTELAIFLGGLFAGGGTLCGSNNGGGVWVLARPGPFAVL